MYFFTEVTRTSMVRVLVVYVDMSLCSRPVNSVSVAVTDVSVFRMHSALDIVHISTHH